MPKSSANKSEPLKIEIEVISENGHVAAAPMHPAILKIDFINEILKCAFISTHPFPLGTKKSYGFVFVL